MYKVWKSVGTLVGKFSSWEIYKFWPNFVKKNILDLIPKQNISENVLKFPFQDFSGSKILEILLKF